jgi:hypothetical protein
MALTLNFTIAQSADCKTITFTETTGNGTDGYADGSNIAHTAVENSDLVIKFPDDTSSRINKSYTPSQAASPNGTLDYVASDFGYSSIPSGVWDITFNIYKADATANVDQGDGTHGVIVSGTTYIVTNSGSVTYNGVAYAQNETFVGVAGQAYYAKAGSAIVSVFEAKKQCNFLIYCGVKECLKTLLLQRCESDCGCSEDYHDAMNELIIDFNAAQLAFTAQNYLCANETIQRLEKSCAGICNDCGC